MKRRNSSGSSISRSSNSSNGSGSQVDSARKAHRPPSQKKLKMDIDPEFPPLDPSNDIHARRIEQRRKMISLGKNTTGYDEYLKQIPKDKRRQRSMKTPMTPEHTLDIPNKRWTGLVRAWRRSLHQYDPPDLKQAFDDEANMATGESPKETPSVTVTPTTVQDQGLEQAHAKGLLVDVGNQQVSPVTVVTRDRDLTCSPAPEMKELDKWDAVRAEDDFCWADVDSDDDLI